jgi:hypothetical protein
MLKLLQEFRGFAELTKRRPASRAPALMLSQMRSHVIHATLPKRRLSVHTDVHDVAALAHPVKINHVPLTPAAPSALPPS